MVFNLFKKKKKKEAKGVIYETLKIKEIIKETPEAITVVFEHPEGSLLEYKSGQYITCIFNVEDGEERRPYSLSSSPYLQELPAITIKKDKNGKVSGRLVETLRSGDEIKIIKPTGKFTTDFDPSYKRHLVMVGGGSGITPLMSILLSALNKEPESAVTLIYANRNEDSIIFKNKLDQLVRENPDRLRVTHVLSQPHESWTGRKGRIDEAMIREIIEESPRFERTEYYMCGPSGLMETAEKTFSSLGAGPKDIIKESFTSSKAKKQKNNNEPLKESEVTLLLDGDEHVFTVKAGKTILQTALDNDIDMPFSCQSGICTTCRCKKLEGEIEMDETEGLTEEELKEGYVLICVGHPKTPKVRIEAD